MQSHSRNESLDVLRSVAILLVIGMHYPASQLLATGWIGVDLFFVLSGLLISGLLFTDVTREGRIRIGRFLFRRGMKIYPALYVFLIATVFFLKNGRQSFWTEVCFLQNYRLLNKAGLPGGPALGWFHLWSLAVEEHFYLLLPLLLVAMHRARMLRFIPRLAGVIVLLCFFARLFQGFSHPYVSYMMYPTHLRIDALFAGVALGYLYHFEPDRFAQFSQWWLPFGTFILLLPAFYIPADSIIAITGY